MPGLDPRRADIAVAGLGPARRDPAAPRRERPDALRSRAARGAGPRLRPPQHRAHQEGRALSGRPPPQRRRARRALRVLVGARAASRAARAVDLRPDARGAQARRPRARVARVRRAAARRRRAHQLRAPPSAFVLPDQERRPARLRSARDRDHRAHCALSSSGDAEEVTRGLRAAEGLAAPDGPDARPRWCGSPKGSTAAMRRRWPAWTSFPRGDDYLVRLRTSGDAELELWAAHRHAAPLEGVLERPLRFEVAGAGATKERVTTC